MNSFGEARGELHDLDNEIVKGEITFLERLSVNINFQIAYPPQIQMNKVRGLQSRGVGGAGIYNGSVCEGGHPIG